MWMSVYIHVVCVWVSVYIHYLRVWRYRVRSRATTHTCNVMHSYVYIHFSLQTWCVYVYSYTAVCQYDACMCVFICLQSTVCCTYTCNVMHSYLYMHSRSQTWCVCVYSYMLQCADMLDMMCVCVFLLQCAHMMHACVSLHIFSLLRSPNFRRRGTAVVVGDQVPRLLYCLDAFICVCILQCTVCCQSWSSWHSWCRRRSQRRARPKRSHPRLLMVLWTRLLSSWYVYIYTYRCVHMYICT